MPDPTFTIEIDTDADDTWGEAGEDVTSDVLHRRRLLTKRGGVISNKSIPAAAGSLSCALNNGAGTYDIGGAYTRGDPMRVRANYSATDYDLWRGRLTRYNVRPELQDQSVELSALGGLHELAGKRGYSTALYSSITVNTAIGHVLDAVGWPAGKRTLGTANTTLEYFWLDRNDDPLQVLNALVNTENAGTSGFARLYEDGAGNIVFEESDAHDTTLDTTFNGDTTEPIVHKLDRYDDGVDRITNTVSLTRRGRGAPYIDPPSFVEVDALSDTSTNSFAFTLGSVPSDGDIIIAILVFSDSGAINTPATGFTLAASSIHGGEESLIYWKRADEETSASYTFTLVGNVPRRGFLAVYRGCTTIGVPWDDLTTATYTNDSTPSASEVTTLGRSRRLVCIFGSNETGGTGPPSGFTERGDESSAEGSAEFSDAVQDAAGASGAKTGSQTATTDGSAFLIALAPPDTPVWQYGEQLVLGNDEVLDIVAQSSDPFTAAVTPTEDEDFTVSAGAVSSVVLDRTSGSSVKITITAGAAGATIDGPPDDTDSGIRLRAQPVSVISETAVEATDATSQGTYGERGLPVGYLYRHELSVANMQSLADNLITNLKDPRPVVTFRVWGNRHDTALTACLAREIGNRVRVLLTRGNIDVTGWIEEIRHTIRAPSQLETTFTIRKVV